MSNELHAFDCPLCAGSFEVEAEWLGQTIPCPHCDGDVELPTAAELAPAETPAASPPATPQPALAPTSPTLSNPTSSKAEPPRRKAEPPRRLTVAERAALRRKINLSLAISGALLLIVVFVVLAQFG